jgi:ribosomal protein S18 acetylase RimI-like enzyme
MTTAVLVVGPLESREASAVQQLLINGLTDRWGTYKAHFNPDIEGFPASYADATVLVAKLAGEVVGTGTLRILSSRRAKISRMSVAAERRRSGIGGILLSHLLAAAREQGMQEVILETCTSWGSAVRFYVKHGFRITHQHDGDTHFLYSLGDA